MHETSCLVLECSCASDHCRHVKQCAIIVICAEESVDHMLSVHN